MGMQTNSKKAEQVGLPATSRLSRSYGKADFVDAFSVDLQRLPASTHSLSLDTSLQGNPSGSRCCWEFATLPYGHSALKERSI
jgi:hypothetical protein